MHRMDPRKMGVVTIISADDGTNNAANSELAMVALGN